ncbi:hypothetical protein LJ739_17425 [Aestuariibacter halophilus]|uniref:Uncharacterized protein n=1 Tax=Fluctibacter halophilus TaxID=226011 RepID=A0ABS8GE12_9ALTE|nr:hypothetical protein [Aestuariibacter halophilus]MCC2618039.1 hypothetical protein [Aestuariibacter halophilus]
MRIAPLFLSLCISVLAKPLFATQFSTQQSLAMEVGQAAMAHGRGYHIVLRYLSGQSIPDTAQVHDIPADGDYFPDGQFLIVRGNLTHDIVLEPMAQLVVAGDIAANVRVQALGMADIYIGGDMQGALRLSSSTNIVIGHNFTGRVESGKPSTTLIINGDYQGQVQPANGRGMLVLTVKGHTPARAIDALYDEDFTSVEGHFAHSDRRKGIYHFAHAWQFYVIAHN